MGVGAAGKGEARSVKNEALAGMGVGAAVMGVGLPL